MNPVLPPNFTESSHFLPQQVQSILYFDHHNGGHPVTAYFVLSQSVE